MKIYFIKRYVFKESFLSNITSVAYFYIFIISSYNVLIKRHIIASILLLWIYILYKIKFDTGNPSIVLILEKKKKKKNIDVSRLYAVERMRGSIAISAGETFNRNPKSS